jgi:DNA-directed RNA polymerase subunit M/transcription elongation factor TFIIS
MKLKEILSIIYGKKCPKCGHRNHLYLLHDNSHSYEVYIYVCNKCGHRYSSEIK